MTEFRAAFLDFGFRRIGAFITDRAIAVRLEDAMIAEEAMWSTERKATSRSSRVAF